MRICYFSLGFMPAVSLGGSIRSAYYLTKSLVERGHEVTVCCTNLATKNETLFPETRSVKYNGVEVVYFSTYKLFPLGRNAFGPFVCPELVGFCRRELLNYDVVHIDGYRDFPCVVATHFCRRDQIPYVIQARGSIRAAYSSVLAKRAFDRLLGCRILRNCALFIASSATEEADYRAMIPPGKRITCIYNGIDLSEYTMLPSRGIFRARYGIGQASLVTYLGRLHPLKGIEILIQAFALCRCRVQGKLAIIGPDEGYKAALVALVRHAGLGDSVIFVDALDGPDKQAAYVDSDVVVYVTNNESFGTVPFEATMCGVPVIIAENSPCGELLDRFGAGFLVPYGNPQGLADTIDGILARREQAVRRVAVAAKEVRRALSWARIAEQYENAYGWVLRRVLTDQVAVQGGTASNNPSA